MNAALYLDRIYSLSSKLGKSREEVKMLKRELKEGMETVDVILYHAKQGDLTEHHISLLRKWLEEVPEELTHD